MKPVVSALNAWSCIVVSIFAIIILSVIGGLYDKNHHSLMGSTSDPASKDHKAVAGSIFTAVGVYAIFLIFCALQAYLNVRASRKGQISLN